MTAKQNIKRLIAASAFALLGAGCIQAATVDFDGSPNGVSAPLVTDGFSFDVARIVNGNCAALECLALNPQRGSSAADFVVMSAVDGEAFDLTSLWFKLLGGPASLVVTGYDSMGTILNTATYSDPPYDHNTGYTIDFAGLFDDVFSVSYTNIGTGNVRVDDINASPVAPVPLPAAGALLLAGVIGLSLFGRRRSVRA